MPRGFARPRLATRADLAAELPDPRCKVGDPPGGCSARIGASTRHSSRIGADADSSRGLCGSGIGIDSCSTVRGSSPFLSLPCPAIQKNR